MALTRGPSSWALVATLGLVGCGSPSTSPDSPVPDKGRWLGAEAIGNTPEPKPDCNPPLSPQLAMNGHGSAVAAWLSDCSVWTARYEPGQGWRQPEIVGSLPPGAPANWMWEPMLAVNDAGTALVVWTTQVTAGEGNRQVWTSVGDSAKGWSVAERIGDRESGPLSEIDNPHVAIDPSGNGVVV